MKKFNVHEIGQDVFIVLVTLSAVAILGQLGTFAMSMYGVSDSTISHFAGPVNLSIGAIAGILSRTTRQPSEENPMPVAVQSTEKNPVHVEATKPDADVPPTIEENP